MSTLLFALGKGNGREPVMMLGKGQTCLTGYLAANIKVKPKIMLKRHGFTLCVKCLASNLKSCMQHEPLKAVSYKRYKDKHTQRLVFLT